MKYVSLFAGIGGFDLALNRLGHECVYANDFDKYCKITYDKNFKNIKRSSKGNATRPDKHNNNSRMGRESQQRWMGHPELDTTSITEVATDSIPDHDLLVGGFPCQAFSIAGKRRGFDDTRGTLFFEIARILRDKRPRHFILENVKGLLSHDSGKTFSTILGILTDLGYEYQWQVLNSKNFGVPQNRERVFIVGHLRGEPRPKVFPIRKDGQFSTSQKRQVSRGVSVDPEEWNSTNPKSELLQDGKDRRIRQLNQPKHSNDRVYGEDGISPTLNTMGGGRRQPKVMNDMRIRRLTPLECERLQGFPDNWTEGVSDTQRYKQLGNAVTVNVVYEVAKRL